MRKLQRESIRSISPSDIVSAINSGAQIVNVSFPFIKDLFMKIGELVKGFQTDKLSTPHGKRLAIEELQNRVEVLQAQNQLQKAWNSQLIKKLQAAGIEISDEDQPTPEKG